MTKNKLPLVFAFALSVFLFCPSASWAIGNDECLECHNDASLAREASTGMKDLLYVDSNRFKYSVHNVNSISCVDCHSDIEKLDLDNDLPHPANLAKVVCESCHEEIGEAYADSVHKKAGKKGVTIACYACHEYHYNTPLAIATVSERQNNFCRKCHDPSKFHDWLPQKETHFNFVECTVCHAPETARHINLRLFDLVQNRFLDTDELLRLLGIDFDGFMDLVDRNKNKVIDEDEFLDMVLMLRQWGVRATFHGELITDIEASVHHVNKGEANSDCTLCHSIDSPFFQDVRITLTKNDGTIKLHTVDRKVLSTYHVEFNALGSSRVRLLDQIGLLLIAGGFMVVLSHLTIRLATTNLRKKNNKSGLDA